MARRKLQIIVASSMAMSFLAAVSAMYFATARYEQATREAQAARARQFVERYVKEVAWQVHADEVAKLANDMANEDGVRRATAAADRQELTRLLPTAERRYAVTSGHVALVGATVYDAHGMTLAKHMIVPDLYPTGTLNNLLAEREGNERLEQLRHVWTFDGRPYLSVAVPIGGLKRITGYLAVHVDPLHALLDLPNRLGMDVALTSLDGKKTLAELKDHELSPDATKLTAEVVVPAPDGAPVFRVEMSADETAAARLMSSIRMWSFAFLFAVLALIALATFALVMFVSRGMAREEAEAAKAALSAKRAEEKNADLKRLNEDLLLREEALQAQNQRFDAALNNMAHGMCMFDKEQRLVVCNSLYLDMYGLPHELGRPGTPLRSILEGRAAADDRHYLANVLETVSRPEPRYTVRELRDGRFVAVAYQPMFGGGWVAVHQDITAQKRAENEIARMARHDGLTNLANRVLFRERMDQALARLRQHGEAFCILMLDLNRFKAVNDTLGHPVGDALLIQVAERLRATVGETDTVARLGGDEFAILRRLDGDAADETAALAERLLAAISAPYDLEGQRAVVATSIGIALAPRDGTEVHELLRNADLALYRAKSDSRTGYCFFRSEMYEEARLLRTLEMDLRAAVENEEFELHYQQILNAASKAVIGAEALVRWRHPERGLISPAEFIPVAEQTGLIVPLGEWVLRKACADAATWPSHIKLAVNLSAVQFKHGDLVDVVATALARSGLPPQRLELEITESIILEKNATNVAILHELGRLGVSIVLDDFGTGYSSLSYLRMFPFHKIKIDKSFVDDIVTREDRASMVVAITGLARSLDIRTTAEGVETASQLELLRAAGCNEVQGYLFGRPCPLSQLTFATEQTDGSQVA